MDDADLREAISAQLGGVLVMNYVVCAEVADPATGERMIAQYHNDALAPWTSLGLLEYALAVERGRLVEDDLDGTSDWEPDDD